MAVAVGRPGGELPIGAAALGLQIVIFLPTSPARLRWSASRRRCFAIADERPEKKGTKSKGFTADERAAMRARAQELKAEARASKNREAGEREVLAAIAAMKGSDRDMAQRLHAVVETTAPALSPKTWYGMPAYARDGKVVCFFKPAGKFKTRYATFGFEEAANLDEGGMWPTSFALTKLTAADEAKIATLVKKAAS